MAGVALVAAMDGHDTFLPNASRNAYPLPAGLDPRQLGQLFPRLPRQAPSEHPQARQGPDRLRNTTPAWDLTTIRIRRVDKEAFEELRTSMSVGGRVVPHWEAFGRVLLFVGRSAGPEIS